MGARSGLEAMQRLVPHMKKRGIRVLPGGDYGFPYNPIGRNARDLEIFVTLFGYSPVDALVAATRLGGQLMNMQVGEIKTGWLADLLLVDGDPTQDVRILQDKNNLKVIVKDGQIYKQTSIH
jgi:imidazolonepropionase-like amidohydrolase